METCRELEVYFEAFLSLALDGGEWSASRLGRFISRKITHGTQWIRGWVSLRGDLAAVAKREVFATAGNGTQVESHSLVTRQN
jgi:hypothetical protein